MFTFVVRVLCIALISLYLSACKVQELSAPIPDTQLNGQLVLPSSGYPMVTDFTFSVSLSKPVTTDYAVVLMIYSPDVNNQWSWLTVDMDKIDATHYSVAKKMEEFSTRYRYKYGIQFLKNSEVVIETNEYAGPSLTVNTLDAVSPQVMWSSPDNNSTGVSPTQAITLVFNEVIDPLSINSASVVVAGNSAASILAYQNRVVIKFAHAFKQAATLIEDAASYTLSISGLADLNGNNMAPYNLSFSVGNPLVQTWAIESRKYSGYCLTVVDKKKRFGDPGAWNPVVELEPCLTTDSDLSQRWFLEENPGASSSGQIVWASNYDYCLSMKSGLDPVLEKCSDIAAQYFRFESRKNYYLLVSDIGTCVAAGVFDAGKTNKIVTSLCTSFFERNHWFVNTRELAMLAPAFMIGNVNILHANIQYKNPVAGVDLSKEQTRELVMYLYQTKAMNQVGVYNQLNLAAGSNKGRGFETENPYYPRNTDTTIPLPKARSIMVSGNEVFNPENYDNTQEGYYMDDTGIHYLQQKVVTQWFSDITNGNAESQEVCAIRFRDAAEVEYDMQTFANSSQALAAGWTITHQYQCGVCSTLKDLAVYMGIPDQTTPVRLCTKRGRAKIDKLDEVKSCIIQTVGFTPMCAEAWAYNGIHTGEGCKSNCLKTYGRDALIWPQLRAVFTMVIAEKFNACPAEVESSDPVFREQMKVSGCPLANENTGKLNDCLWCDEKTSGPGFKYAAGRTRRGSGLISEIPRPNDKLFYEANHTLYFNH